jgi:hypothetical protein
VDGVRAEPLRHRQTKEAETDMFNLQPLRHISTLPNSDRRIAAPQLVAMGHFRKSPNDRQAYAGRSFSNASASFKFDAFVNAASIRC